MTKYGVLAVRRVIAPLLLSLITLFSFSSGLLFESDATAARAAGQHVSLPNAMAPLTTTAPSVIVDSNAPNPVCKKVEVFHRIGCHTAAGHCAFSKALRRDTQGSILSTIKSADQRLVGRVFLVSIATWQSPRPVWRRSWCTTPTSLLDSMHRTQPGQRSNR